MKNKTQLSVRPVRKTKKPVYPSWQEPNPLEQPYAQPYPFTQKAINWLAASGLCGALFLMPEAEGMAKQVDKVEAVEGDSLGNPFPFKWTGLPFAPSSFGTGEPSRLSGRTAIVLIDSIFREAGFNFEPTVLKTKEGNIAISKFDKEKKIGYLWLEGNLDSDLMVRYGDDSYVYQGSKIKKRYPDNQIEGYYRDFISLNAEIKRHSNFSISILEQNFSKALEGKISAGNTSWTFDNKCLYYEYIIRKEMESGYIFKNMPSNLFEHFSKVLAMQPSDEKNKQLDLLIDIRNSHMKNRNLNFEPQLFADALLKAKDYKSPKKAISRIDFLRKVLMYTNNEQKAILKKSIAESKDGWKKSFKIAQQWWDEMTLNKQELLALEAAANRGRYAVALISARDYRLAYNTFLPENLDSFVVSAKNRFLKTNPMADSQTVANYLNNPQFKTEAMVLKNLEKQVLDYIHWAKQQRGY